MDNYKIVKESVDPREAIIEKSNLTANFTIRDMEGEQLNLKKVRTELAAKRDFEQKSMENIEHHHPFVKEFTEEQLFTIALYQKALSFVKAIGPKLEEIENQLKESEEEMAKLVEKFGFDLNAPVPAEPVKSDIQVEDLKKDDEAK